MTDFTITDWNRIAQALRIAADSYNGDAHIAASAGEDRLARQFDLQRDNAIVLASRIEREHGL